VFTSQRNDGAESFALEVVLQTLGDIAVILNDQDWSNHSFSECA
jgi:hypothetical protein